MTDSPTGKQGSGFPQDPEQARLDLELTRRELGETIDELERRLNAPARVREQADHAARAVHDRISHSVVDGAGEAAATVRRNPSPVLATGAGLVGFLIVIRFLRRRRARSVR